VEYNPKSPSSKHLDGLDLKVESNEGKDQTLEVLHQVVEATQTFRVLALVDVHKAACLGRGEGNVFVAHHYFQLLSTNSIRLRPSTVIFLKLKNKLVQNTIWIFYTVVNYE